MEGFGSEAIGGASTPWLHPVVSSVRILRMVCVLALLSAVPPQEQHTSCAEVVVMDNETTAAEDPRDDLAWLISQTDARLMEESLDTEDLVDAPSVVITSSSSAPSEAAPTSPPHQSLSSVSTESMSFHKASPVGAITSYTPQTESKRLSSLGEPSLPPHANKEASQERESFKGAYQDFYIGHSLSDETNDNRVLFKSSSKDLNEIEKEGKQVPFEYHFEARDRLRGHQIIDFTHLVHKKDESFAGNYVDVLQLAGRLQSTHTNHQYSIDHLRSKAQSFDTAESVVDTQSISGKRTKLIMQRTDEEQFLHRSQPDGEQRTRNVLSLREEPKHDKQNIGATEALLEERSADGVFKRAERSRRKIESVDEEKTPDNKETQEKEEERMGGEHSADEENSRDEQTGEEDRPRKGYSKGSQLSGHESFVNGGGQSDKQLTSKDYLTNEIHLTREDRGKRKQSGEDHLLGLKYLGNGDHLTRMVHSSDEGQVPCKEHLKECLEGYPAGDESYALQEEGGLEDESEDQVQSKNNEEILVETQSQITLNVVKRDVLSVRDSSFKVRRREVLVDAIALEGYREHKIRHRRHKIEHFGDEQRPSHAALVRTSDVQEDEYDDDDEMSNSLGVFTEYGFDKELAIGSTGSLGSDLNREIGKAQVPDATDYDGVFSNDELNVLYNIHMPDEKNEANENSQLVSSTSSRSKMTGASIPTKAPISTQIPAPTTGDPMLATQASLEREKVTLIGQKEGGSLSFNVPISTQTSAPESDDVMLATQASFERSFPFGPIIASNNDEDNNMLISPEHEGEQNGGKGASTLSSIENAANMTSNEIENDDKEEEPHQEKKEEKESDFEPAYIPSKLPLSVMFPSSREAFGQQKEENYIDPVPIIRPFFYLGGNEDHGTYKSRKGSQGIWPSFLSSRHRSKSKKLLFEYDSERSESEEVHNRVSGRQPSPLHFAYGPGQRYVRRRFHKTDMTDAFSPGTRHSKTSKFVEHRPPRDPGPDINEKKQESSAHNQLGALDDDNKNINNMAVVVRNLDSKIVQRLQNCTDYTQINPLDQFELSEILKSPSENGVHVFVIFNFVKINVITQQVLTDRLRQIVDYLTNTYDNILAHSFLSIEQQRYQQERMNSMNATEGNKTLEVDKVRSVEWAMNDAILDFCAKSFPICVTQVSLKDIIRKLKISAQHQQEEVNLYSTNTIPTEKCPVNEICVGGRTVPPVLPDLPDSEVKIDTIVDGLCLIAPRRYIQTLHVTINLTDNKKDAEKAAAEDYGRAAKKAKNKGNRVYAQTGLVLHDILPRDLKQYDKNRPPKYEGQATIVYFHVTVLSVDSINEESMTYVADIFLAQSWRDHRLRLPENMTEEYRILDVEWLHNIWRPDCFFKNAKKVTFHEMSVPNHYLWLYHDKTLLYMAKLTLVLSCAMKFETYPHDTQICSMMIESLSHTTHDLVFKWNETDPLVVNPDIELPQLDISRNNTEDCTLTYSTGNFTCLAVVFNLKRRLGYHLFHTYIPSAITVVMSWISFWIKPEAIPARVTLGVTSLLTLATQNQQSQSSLPPVSYIKAIDVWMSSCTVFVFASLVEFGIVNHFMNMEPLVKDMTGYSIEDFTEFDEKRDFSEDRRSNGTVAGRSRSRSRSRMRSLSPGQPQYVVHRCSGKDIAVYIDKFSRYFFPFSFLVLNISYWTNYDME